MINPRLRMIYCVAAAYYGIIPMAPGWYVDWHRFEVRHTDGSFVSIRVIKDVMNTLGRDALKQQVDSYRQSGVL